MRTVLANLTLWFFGIWAVASLCAMGVLLFRFLRYEYWAWRLRRAPRRSYPPDVQPILHLVRKSIEEP